MTRRFPCAAAGALPALALLLAAGCAPPGGRPGVVPPVAASMAPERVPAAQPSAAAAALPVTLGGIAFHSLQWQVKLVALPPGFTAPALQRELQQSLEAVDAVLTTYRPSELMRLNAQPVGEWMPASPELLRALAVADAVHGVSAGAYDPTVGPLVELWGFGATPAPVVLPSATALAAARARVGWRHVGIDGKRVRRLADVRLDLSSLGEGTGVEALARVLDRAGVKDYLVRIAGTSRARGQRPDGGAWILAVEVPDGSGLPGRLIEARERVISTSGAYRNVRTIEGRRFSHTINPVTGFPVMHEGVSVTVLLPAGEGADRADALATALNVLGPDRGLELAAREGWAVLYIERRDDTFRERWSPAFDPWRGR